MTISVTIITLNEEENLERCLKSISSITSEIIIVDSGSKDKTLEIAKKYKARVFVRKFDNYANQKNFALRQARGEWILSLDADEEITPELKNEIKLAIDHKQSLALRARPLAINAYSIPRKNIIFGKFIKYSRWQPELDRHIWLFKKESGRWVGRVHEEVVVGGEVGRLKNAKIHYQYKTVREFVEMLNSYSELEAEEKVRKGVRFSFFRLFFDPIYNFLVRYIYRLGFLDGLHGFVLSYLMAIYHFIVWVKIWERER